MTLSLQTVGRMVGVWYDGEATWFEVMVTGFNTSPDLVDSHGSLFDPLSLP